jgi:hypothetical protein
MARAFELGLIGAAIAFAAPALAGAAPVAYYPSLGYGQTPPPVPAYAPPPRGPEHAPPPEGLEPPRPFDREDHWAERREHDERHNDIEADDHAYAGASREEYDDDSGWRAHWRKGPPRGPRERAADYGAHIPDSFFADAGGVGPDEFAWGGGGGGYVIGGASGGAYASAYASASASAHVSARFGRHGGGHDGHVSHGCGCKR